jgi:hypothetical protein
MLVSLENETYTTRLEQFVQVLAERETAGIV